MIKNQSLRGWGSFSRQHAIGDFARYAVRARGHHVGDVHPFNALFPAAFQLMRRHRAAPQKTFFKSDMFFPYAQSPLATGIAD